MNKKERSLYHSYLYGKSSLDELYKRPSAEKRRIYNHVMRACVPSNSLGTVRVWGNVFTFSVGWLQANGRELHVLSKSCKKIIKLQEV